MAIHNIRIAGIEKESIVDGPGIRTVLFTQGCPHHCEGCHNPSTQDFGKGYMISTSVVKSIISDYLNECSIDGITISGGEPFCQAEACADIAQYAHSLGLNVWCYTGWTIEELSEYPWAECLLKEIDILVDGRFEQEHKTLDEPFIGSMNQRIIDMKKKH